MKKLIYVIAVYFVLSFQAPKKKTNSPLNISKQLYTTQLYPSIHNPLSALFLSLYQENLESPHLQCFKILRPLKDHFFQ